MVFFLFLFFLVSFETFCCIFYFVFGGVKGHFFLNEFGRKLSQNGLNFEFSVAF